MAHLLPRALQSITHTQSLRWTLGLCLMGYYWTFFNTWSQVFGPKGMVGHHEPLHSLWPLSFLMFNETTFQITSLLFVVSLTLFTIGIRVRETALISLLINITLFNNNPYIHPNSFSLFNILLISFLFLKNTHTKENHVSFSLESKLKLSLTLFISLYFLSVCVQRILGFTTLENQSLNVQLSSLPIATYITLAFEGGFWLFALSSLNWLLLPFMGVYLYFTDFHSLSTHNYALIMTPWLVLSITTSPSTLFHQFLLHPMFNKKAAKESKEQQELREKVEKFREKHNHWIKS